VDLVTLKVSSASEIVAAFATLVSQRVGAFMIGTDALFFVEDASIVELAARNAMPSMSALREHAKVGGLMSYGASLPDAYRLAGTYVGRILKGEKPADLPVRQVTRVELVINMKTAKSLGLTVPLTLLGRADEVIE
jgi:putative ABC transport system substrate-binding protein